MEGWRDGMGRRGFCICFGVVVCDVICVGLLYLPFPFARFGL